MKSVSVVEVYTTINPKTTGAGGGGQFDPLPLWFFEKCIF